MNALVYVWISNRCMRKNCRCSFHPPFLIRSKRGSWRNAYSFMSFAHDFRGSSTRSANEGNERTKMERSIECKYLAVRREKSINSLVASLGIITIWTKYKLETYAIRSAEPKKGKKDPFCSSSSSHHLRIGQIEKLGNTNSFRLAMMPSICDDRHMVSHISISKRCVVLCLRVSMAWP